MEVEIKLHVPSGISGGPLRLFERLAAIPSLMGQPLGAPAPSAACDVYYDTAGGALARAVAGLRLRLENGRALVTLKVDRQQAGALSSRAEYEEELTPASLERILAQVRPLIGAEPVSAESFARGEATGALVPVLRVRTDRLSRMIGDMAVLSLDRVEYPGLADDPYWDIEVEARAGTGAAALRAAERALQELAGHRLEPGTQSKLERGLRLRAVHG